MRLARLLTLSLVPLLLVACGAEGAASEGATAPAATAASAVPATGAEAAPAVAGNVSAAPETTDPAKFELDMDRVDRWLDANRRLGALVEQDPSLEDVTAADASEPREAYIARLEAHPGVSGAIRDAGMTATEFALTTETLLAAVFAIGMVDAGAIPELPAELKDTPSVRFVQANKDEITRKIQALQAGEG